MNVLGLNYWPGYNHDTAATLIVDGKIVAMAEEERFTESKHAFDTIPHNAIRYCLQEGHVTLDQIDYVAISWDPEKIYNPRNIDRTLTADQVLSKLFPKDIFKFEKMPELIFVDHHQAHAASAYYVSGFNDAAVLVVDGQGESSSISIWEGSGSKLQRVEDLDQFGLKSLGYFYDSASAYVGLGIWGTGKFMGLSSYGKPVHQFDNIELTEDGFTFTGFEGRVQPGKNNALDEGTQIRNIWIEKFKEIAPLSSKRDYYYDPVRCFTYHDLDFTDDAKNFAASVQYEVEKIMAHISKIALKKTHKQKLCLAGGVALNCLANSVINKLEEVEDMFVQPAASDSGTSLGAALAVYMKYNADRPTGMFSPYGGPSFSNKDIQSLLDQIGIAYKKSDDIYKEAATRINEGKIVGWFQHRAEFGPRALGSRSIIANPCIADIKDIVNRRVKFREMWRPFAPSILAEHMDEYFEDGVASPYMLFTAMFKEEYRNAFPGVTHIDGSARLQTVHEEINEDYYRLIKAFYETSGVPMILNTSFNMRGKPIVNSPYHAIQMFYTTGIDTLILGDYVIEKEILKGGETYESRVN